MLTEIERNKINNSLKLLLNFLEKVNYKGWDVYDGLNSKLFKMTPFYNSSILRLIWIQIFKRSPVNFRKIALVPKGCSPKGKALFVSSFIRLNFLEKAKSFLEELEEIGCRKYGGISWGYDFDWESRAFFVPAGEPNIVSTVFVANAFLDYFEIVTNKKDKKFLEIAYKACEFILNNLIVYEDKNVLCFGYIRGKDVRVHNANMLAAALLGKVYKYTNERVFFEKSFKSIKYSLNFLRKDYSWPYGERAHHQFVDNFHTGFNLVALYDWMIYTGHFLWKEELKKAYNYFLTKFWLNNGCPKYYNNSLYPIDIHCSAQGVVTCIKLRELNNDSINLAKKILLWAIDNMQDKKAGYFYYQKTRMFTIKIPYIRWSQAWMLYAFAIFLDFLNKNK